MTHQLERWKNRAVVACRALRKDDRDDLIQRILAQVGSGNLVLLMNEARELLEDIAQEGGAAALAQVGITDDESIVDQVNEHAVEYAKDRAAEMVGKKWVDGELVDNPNPTWRIDEATRDMIRATVEQAEVEGWSNDRLASALEEAHAFSAERAETIARTETAFADTEGNVAAWKASGLVAGKEWLTAEGCCDECAGLNGTIIALDEDFEDGGPPAHPNCRCTALPVLTEPDEG